MIDYETMRENLATCKRLCGEGLRHQEGCPYELNYSESSASPTEPELTPLQRELLIAREERDAARTEAFDWRERALKAERGAEPYHAVKAGLAIVAIQQLIKLEVDSLRVEYDVRMQALEERHRQRSDTEPAPPLVTRAQYEGSLQTAAHDSYTRTERDHVEAIVKRYEAQSWSGAEVVPRGSSNPPTYNDQSVMGPDMNEGGLD